MSTLKLSEQQVLLQSLQNRRSDLEKRIARLDARREADEKEWSRLAESLREQYGTTDLVQIRARLDAEREENSKALLAAAAQLDLLEQQCTDMEQTLQRLDAGEPN